MELRVGATLISAVDATSVVVVRAPGAAVDISCGGSPMLAKGEQPGAVSPQGAPGAGLQLGKRYAAADLGLELLCTKPGEYPVAVNGAVLEQKAAKPLPASD